MPLFDFNFDFAARRKEREAEQRLLAARQGLRQALERRGTLPQAPDDLAGVTGDNAIADLQAELRNEELTNAASRARDDFGVDWADALVGLEGVGIDSKRVSDAIAAEERRRAIEEVRGELTPEQFLDANNAKEISPFRLNGAGIIDRYRGDYRSTPAVDALEKQRRMAALASEAASGNSDALAAFHRARADRQEFDNQAIEDLLADPTDPLLFADIINRKPVAKPQRVKLRRKDGSEQIMDAIPNQQGGFDYRPAMAGGEPLISEPDAGDDTPLQRDTAYIATVLKVPPNEALLYKLQAKGKAPAEAWADLVGRLVSQNVSADPDQIKEQATAVWAIARPGEPVPKPKPKSAPRPSSAASDEQDTIQRAEADGYHNFGQWVPGKGVEILDDAGRVVGHYQ